MNSPILQKRNSSFSVCIESNNVFVYIYKASFGITISLVGFASVFLRGNDSSSRTRAISHYSPEDETEAIMIEELSYAAISIVVDTWQMAKRTPGFEERAG